MAEIAVPSDEKGSRAHSLPWTQVFIEALPVAPVWGGVALAAAQFCVGFAYMYTLGELADVFPAVVFALLVGSSPVASMYSRRAALACLRDLRPALDIPESRFLELGEEVTRWDPSWQRVIGISSLVVGLFAVLNEPGVVGRFPLGHPMLPWVIWMNLAAIWLATRTIAQEISVSRRFARLGREHAVVDLMDEQPLMPFARRGVQGALVPILLISIFSLLFVSDSAGDAVPVTQALVVAIAAYSLMLPVHGVHRRLVDQKQRQLARLAVAIRETEEPVLAARAGEAAAASARLYALLALRAQVASAREWPWDLPTLIRFALYVAIGVGSWLGGAIVERIVDVALG